MDAVGYLEKLTEIIKSNDNCDVTVARMKAPCCYGIGNAVNTVS
ncbi:MAG: hypothetical protein ACLTBR_01345 [Anaerostipes sp.]